MAGAGDALRARREARGASLDEAARATRIPSANLAAIEAGRFHDLPSGPYRAGQIRAYCTWLGVDPGPPLAEAVEAAPPDAPAPRTPLWGIRIVAATACLVLLGLVGWGLAGGERSEPQAAPAVEAPDQLVKLTARRTTHVKVLVDGEVVMDRRLPGGEAIEVAGHDRVEVHLQGADAARVEYNGDLIVPQGRQDMPRRLVFIDDEG